MGKPTICICENKDADQLLALFCACTGRFVSDLFGNHIVGFPRGGSNNRGQSRFSFDDAMGKISIQVHISNRRFKCMMLLKS